MGNLPFKLKAKKLSNVQFDKIQLAKDNVRRDNNCVYFRQDILDYKQFLKIQYHYFNNSSRVISQASGVRPMIYMEEARVLLQS